MGIEQFIETITVQPAVYWGNPQNDGFGGVTYDAPVQIYVRWEQETQVFIPAFLKMGKEIIVKAKVIVRDDVDEGGMIQLATLTDLTLESDLQPDPDDASEILKFSKIPLIKKTDEFVRIAYL